MRNVFYYRPPKTTTQRTPHAANNDDDDDDVVFCCGQTLRGANARLPSVMASITIRVLHGAALFHQDLCTQRLPRAPRAMLCRGINVYTHLAGILRVCVKGCYFCGALLVYRVWVLLYIQNNLRHTQSRLLVV